MKAEKSNKEEQPRIRNFGDHDDYNPHHLLKIYPIGGTSSKGIIRDKDGCAIGGGESYRIRDSHGNRYELLITPALYEDLTKSLHKPFYRSIPGKLFVEVNLMDFPQSAIDTFKDELFYPHEGEEYNEVSECYEEYYYPPVFKQHEHHEWKPQKFVLALKTRTQFGMLRAVLDDLIDEYAGQSCNKYLKIGNNPIAFLEYIFTFPEPWVVNRVFSPQYWYQGRFTYKDNGFDYAWYYGRFGIFEDWGDSCDTPHKNEHHLGDWDRWLKQ